MGQQLAQEGALYRSKGGPQKGSQKGAGAKGGADNRSWHDLVEECAVPKGAVFAIRGDTVDSGKGHKDKSNADQRANISWGRSRMGGRFAAACRRGALKSSNRNSFFFVEFSGRDFALGIVHGQGPRGQAYSQLISWHLPLLLLRSTHYPSDLPEALISAFSDMARLVREMQPGATEKANSPHGGTCGVVVRRGGSLYAASVGESRAVLYSAFESHLLSRDPSDSPSKAWLRRCAGVSYSPASGKKGSGIKEWPESTLLGAAETPELKIYPLDPTSAYTVVVGSDGLWDALSIEDVRGVVWNASSSNNTTQGVRDCVGLALSRWTAGLDDASAGVPDITCVAVGFGQEASGFQSPSKADTESVLSRTSSRTTATAMTRYSCRSTGNTTSSSRGVISLADLASSAKAESGHRVVSLEDAKNGKAWGAHAHGGQHLWDPDGKHSSRSITSPRASSVSSKSGLKPDM